MITNVLCNVFSFSGQVLEPDCHDLRVAVYGGVAEELEAIGGWLVGTVGGPLVHHPWAEGAVELVGAEGPRVQRPDHEFPEGIEALKAGPARVVVVSGGFAKSR
jgi:hypothetical protein